MLQLVFDRTGENQIGAPWSHLERSSSPLESRGVWQSEHLATSTTRYRPLVISLSLDFSDGCATDLSAEAGFVELCGAAIAAPTATVSDTNRQKATSRTGFIRIRSSNIYVEVVT